MKTLLQITLATIILALPMLSRAQPVDQCSAIVVPQAELELYENAGVWSPAIKALQNGQVSRGTSLAKQAWRKAERALAQAFSTKKCDLKTIRKTLNHLILTSPPAVVTGEDRFLPPKVVTLLIARALCDAGNTKEALSWLIESALAGVTESAQAAVAIFESMGQDEMSAAIKPLARKEKR